MSMKQKSKYRTYGTIYQKQCVNCLKEGTYNCALEIDDEKCRNYESVKEG